MRPELANDVKVELIDFGDLCAFDYRGNADSTDLAPKRGPRRKNIFIIC
jgi:hypothetical protein